MRICKFFQQGTCKFGNHCKFLHEGYNYGQSVLRSNNFRDDDYSNTQNYERGGFPRQDYSANYTEYSDAQNYGRSSNAFSNRQDYNVYSKYNFQRDSSVKPANQSGELMQAVQQELINTERGGQWPLSCFAPFKEKACIPGFEDFSPEEIRWMMYQASQIGAVEDCKLQIQALRDSAQQKKQRILNPDAETYSVINDVYEGRIRDSVQQNSVIDTFSFALPQNGAPPNSSVFDNNNAIETFSFSQPVNNFENRPNVQDSNSRPINAFGERSNQNIFGNNSQAGISEEHKNIFQQIQPQTFSSLNSPFGNSSSTNIVSSHSPSASYLYSAVSELTDDERDQFINSSFTLGKIPTKPPPKEMCF